MSSVQEKLQKEEPNLTPGWGVVKIHSKKYPSKIISIINNTLSLQIFPKHDYIFNLPFDSREINQYKFDLNTSQIIEIEQRKCIFVPSLHIALDDNFLIPFCQHNKIL